VLSRRPKRKRNKDGTVIGVIGQIQHGVLALPFHFRFCHSVRAPLPDRFSDFSIGPRFRL